MQFWPVGQSPLSFTQALFMQRWFVPQLPQLPPQPSEPQVLPVQFGTQAVQTWLTQVSVPEQVPQLPPQPS